MDNHGYGFCCHAYSCVLTISPYCFSFHASVLSIIYIKKMACYVVILEFYFISKVNSN